MHSAPSVTYPVGRSRMARRLVLGLWCLGACGVLAWCLQVQGAPTQTAVLLLALLGSAFGAASAARLDNPAELRWDGQHWSTEGPRALAQAAATVHLDLQSLLLVRLRAPERPAQWLWLDRSTFPARWLDLRRALHARASGERAPVGEAAP